MRVLTVAFPFAPVGLDAAGGAEQIAALLDRGLAIRGHQSIAVARDGSRVQGILITPALGEETETHPRWQDAVDGAVHSWRPDIVHMHGLDFYRYLPRQPYPVLATLHLPPSFYPQAIFHLDRPRTWLNCVSSTQRLTCPCCTRIAAVVPNGVLIDVMVPTADPAGDYVVAIGRICPEKGLHLAVDAAEKAGMPLHLAGKVFPYADHIRYWREVLEPRLRPPHRFVGPVGIAQKAVLLGGARCLLVPSLVPETSSLIAMEALACGTPVVAFAAGALAEIVEPGRTGFLVHSTSEMAEAIRCVEALDRSECRNVACSRFSEQAMVAAYIKLYENLLQRSNDRAGR